MSVSLLLAAAALAQTGAHAPHAPTAGFDFGVPGLLSPVQCGMPAFLGLEPPAFVASDVPPRPPSAEKLLRDAYSVTAHELLTDNFAFRWGNSGGVTVAEVERLAEAFELAWLEQVDVQGHPVPTGADDYRFNVYIGDSGNGAPSGGGAAGYFWYDDAGWPMVVVGAGTLNDGDYADITAAHEFYHAIQGGTDRYPYEGDSAWFWEASATWASATVYPENIYYASFLFGYAFLPHYAANYFNYADSWNVEDYYQYGAFIIPLHLSELTADRDLIRQTWTDTGPERDPLSMLQRLLSDRGLSFDDAFLDHAARMATFDYPSGSGYETMAGHYTGMYSESDNMVAAEVSAAGTDGFVEGPRGLEPYRYGYNAIRIDVGDAEQVDLFVEGEAEGDRGNPASWGATAVVHSRGSRTYTALDWDGTSGSASLSDLDGEDVWLVVAAWTDETRDFDREQFSYQYAVTMDGTVPDPDPDPDPDPQDTGEPGVVDDTDAAADTGDRGWGETDAQPLDADKSGCATVGAAGSWAVVCGLLGVVARRRQS